MQNAISFDECPIASLNPDRDGPYCGDRQTHTILLAGHGPVNVCGLHAEVNDRGERRLTIYTAEPVAAASNG